MMAEPCDGCYFGTEAGRKVLNHRLDGLDRKLDTVLKQFAMGGSVEAISTRVTRVEERANASESRMQALGRDLEKEVTARRKADTGLRKDLIRLAGKGIIALGGSGGLVYALAEILKRMAH